MKFRDKPLKEISDSEWEALCDGCGRCCMRKFEDEDTGRMVYTNIACRLLDCATCRCSDYAHRTERVPDCMDIRHFVPEQYRWLPETCAYRLRFEGEPLPEWHPLLVGNAERMMKAGVSMRKFCISEDDVEKAGS